MRADIRVFRLDRVRQIIPIDQTFDRPQGFLVLDVVLRAIAQTPGRWEVRVRLDTTMAHARELVPLSFGMLDLSENGVLMRCFVQQLDWIARFLLGLDCACTILAPDELHTAMADLAQRAARLATSSNFA